MKVTVPKFSTKKELFAYLAKNKGDLLALKKAELKRTDITGDAIKAEVLKALNTSFVDDVTSGEIKREVILNTYNWMDSHDDVHIDNIFSKSITDVAPDKKFHLHDHEQKITAKVGIPFEFSERSVSWRDMGVDCDGTTMALFMKTNIMKELNPQVFAQYLRKEINQHSVGMIYVKLDLAINDPDYKDEYFVFSKYIAGIGNKEKALDQGFFWAVTEAKLIEGSAVLAGSNELTPTVENTEKHEQDQPKKSFYQLITDGIKEQPKEKTFYEKLLG